jgi:subtilisin family serine protease
VSFVSNIIAGRGILVAAAAGNDSWALPISQLKPAQLPARDELVVGVQASNIGGGRACFSNRGDIAAPGCGLLSLAIPHPPKNPFGYVYWAGTSFAAALVSGLAALLSEVTPWNPGALTSQMHGDATPSGDITLPGGIARVPDGL